MNLFRCMILFIVIFAASCGEKKSGIEFLDAGYPEILTIAKESSKLAMVDFYSNT